MKRALAVFSLATSIIGFPSGDTCGEEVAFYYNKIAFQYATTSDGGARFGDTSAFPALPADFFAPGSLPFEGLLTLDSGNVEVEVKESGEKGGTEDINIGVGELQECSISKSAPFEVHYDDGATELWNVEMRLDPLETSGFEFDFTHNPPGAPDGGAILPIDSFIDVHAVITFSNTPTGGTTRYRYFSIIDRTRLTTTDAMWAHRHNRIAGGENRDFVPGADPADPSAELQLLYFQGGGLNLPLRLVEVVPEPSAILLLVVGASILYPRARRTADSPSHRPPSADSHQPQKTSA